MPLNLIGPEGLFTRIGHLIYGVDDVVNLYRGTSLSDRVDLIQQDYANSDQNLVDSLYSQLSGSQTSHTAMINYWRTLAQNTVTQMINEYQPQYKRDYPNSLGFLFKYLIDNNQTVTRNTVSTTVTPGAGNQGNGLVVVNPYNNIGLPQEYMFNEQVTVRVTRDYQSGATPGQETLQFSGVYGTTDQLSWLWPQGSNALTSVTAISPDTKGGNSTKNWLSNGNMESFTTNVPTDWHIQTGVAGTTIFQDTTAFYDGLSSLKFIGNGTETTALRTQFGVDFSGGAVPNDQFIFSLFYMLGSTPASGTLTVSLVDGTGTVLLDINGLPSSVSVDLTGKDTSWHTLNGFLRMPTILPPGMYLMISLSVPLPAGVSINIDRISLARPVFFYPGGPQLACFSGSNRWMVGDTYTIQTINAFDGLIQSGCNKLLNLTNYGLMLPSTTGVATIPDSLVV